MNSAGSTWALVLAAGDGARLRSLTTNDAGLSIPKQFCSFRGGGSLLQDAVKRAQQVTPISNICAVVAPQHRTWWCTQLAYLPAANVTVQPLNRGTGNGILLPLLQLLDRDPYARVVLLPADHHVDDEAVLVQAISGALALSARRRDETVLLGLQPDEADRHLGYIVPEVGSGDDDGAMRISEFVEKPVVGHARLLIKRGALWNSFIVASSAQALLQLFRGRFPEIVEVMRQAVRQDAQRPGVPGTVSRLYERLPTMDFSRDILAEQTDLLRVMAVPPCGWSDLGTPERVGHALLRFPAQPVPQAEAGRGHLNLATQYFRMLNTADRRREPLVECTRMPSDAVRAASVLATPDGA
ncbi:MAG: sugar phosphate nucleotidyltransferase [Proteobacteria bacterium]|nr:sugar phosphate nucleotidyltransferase [Pseudomonadota bacterium]